MINQEKISMEDFLAACKKKREDRLAILFALARSGVEFIDPDNTYVDETVTIGQGTTVYPGVILSGNTVIGRDCLIGAGTRIVDSAVGDGTEIQASHILESRIGERCKIGPFAYVRPDCRIGDGDLDADPAEIEPCCGLASLTEARSATIGT